MFQSMMLDMMVFMTLVQLRNQQNQIRQLCYSNCETQDIGNITNEAIDSIVNRLVPGFSCDVLLIFIGTSHADFPEMILRDYTFSDSDNLSCKCEEILQSRKTEQYGRLYDYDCSYVISVPEGMPPLYWYMCMLMYRWILVLNRDILRDCQLLMSLILRDGCRDHCSIMNASSDFEYMCSCHTQTQKVAFEFCVDSSVQHWIIITTT